MAVWNRLCDAPVSWRSGFRPLWSAGYGAAQSFMADSREVMIWTEEGVWLQGVDERGQTRSSYVGRLSLVSVEAFCRQHGLVLEVFREPRSWSVPCRPSHLTVTRSEHKSQEVRSR